MRFSFLCYAEYVGFFKKTFRYSLEDGKDRQSRNVGQLLTMPLNIPEERRPQLRTLRWAAEISSKSVSVPFHSLKFNSHVGGKCVEKYIQRTRRLSSGV